MTPSGDKCTYIVCSCIYVCIMYAHSMHVAHHGHDHLCTGHWDTDGNESSFVDV